MALGLLLLIGGAWAVSAIFATDERDDTLTHKVERSNLRITVNERGSLESQKTVDGTCQLRGYSNKIIFIVDEGETVKKDDVVVRFDSAEIEKEIAQVEIQVNTAKSKAASTLQEIEVKINEGDSLIAAADLELKLADLDLKKYRDGDYIVEENKLNGLIALAEVELQKANDALENTKMLVKKGFREPEQLRGAQQQVQSAKFNLARDKETLNVLQNFQLERQMTELGAKFKEAGLKLERAKKTKDATVSKAKSEHESAKAELVIVERELAEWKEQLDKCVIKAAQTGVLAYANEEWYDSDRRIREGAVVYRRQKIFSIPNLQLMQVKVKVHESVVKKVSEGQRAIVRVDAFPNSMLKGFVKTVSQLADSSHSWGRGGVKEYSTVVTLDGSPTIAIKPGMNAEVEILVDQLTNVIAVPVQAVTENKHKHFVYIKTGADFERTEVEVGQSNNRMVEIKSGVDVGSEVALDARARGIVDFENEELEDDGDEFNKEESSETQVEATDDSTIPVKNDKTPSAEEVKVESSDSQTVKPETKDETKSTESATESKKAESPDDSQPPVEPKSDANKDSQPDESSDGELEQEVAE